MSKVQNTEMYISFFHYFFITEAGREPVNLRYAVSVLLTRLSKHTHISDTGQFRRCSLVFVCLTRGGRLGSL